MSRIIRLLDFFFASFGILILSPLFLLLIIFGMLDTGYPIFTQERLGKSKKVFILYKFRSMKLNTKQAPTHLINSASITRYGSFLRRSKLDELPQLWNVFIGDMSFVGPRPALADQIQVITAREKYHVLDFKPGITGLAQIKRIDMSNPDTLASLDAEMMKNITLKKYFYYIVLTVTGAGSGDVAAINRANKN